ncbi:hypothetical protein NC651_009695 [Populus alba x Populus x berolinensis]|nr:hypothetical protein NC651_009695 [Populus alba x Populus x berolinensis]
MQFLFLLICFRCDVFGILTSSYGEHDFLESLPRKLIISLSALSFLLQT